MFENDAEREEYDAYAEQEYYERPYEVNCKVCGTTDHASQAQLQAKGWALGGHGEFCPSH